MLNLTSKFDTSKELLIQRYEIGVALGLSRRTIEHHIENIREKTQCKSRSELIDKFVDIFINNN